MKNKAGFAFLFLLVLGYTVLMIRLLIQPKPVLTYVIDCGEKSYTTSGDWARNFNGVLRIERDGQTVGQYPSTCRMTATP